MVAVAFAMAVCVACGKQADAADAGAAAPHRVASGTRNVTFSGYQWTVRSSGGNKQGPGPNFFNDGERNVFVDAQSALHLVLSHDNSSGWQCAEVVAAKPLGYGSYTFTTQGRVDNLGERNPHVVLGMFLYQDDSHEIDIEMSRWGNATAGAANADNAVQPVNAASGVYWEQPPVACSVHQIDWQPDGVRFSSTECDKVQPYHKWAYAAGGKPPVPTGSDAMLVHLNLWLFRGEAPTLPVAQDVEVVFTGFRHESVQQWL